MLYYGKEIYYNIVCYTFFPIGNVQLNLILYVVILLDFIVYY